MSTEHEGDSRRGASSSADGGAGPALAEAIRDRYRRVFGTVPAGIDQRITVCEATGRLAAAEEIERLRTVLLADNPLEGRIQQLVHFAQLVALRHDGPARLHARGAMLAGATLVDLVGVAETSLVTSGMPAYALAIEIVGELLDGAPTGAALPAETTGGQR
ncbi:MAG: carboxymuconolactone decarboxylase family protein [Actinomycetota bacterium]|nr:carboxymuconolactone decarboxylase family protein [Actinomycetota bacterium]